MKFEISNAQIAALRELLAAAKEYRDSVAMGGPAYETLRLNQAMKAVAEMFSLIIA